MKSNPADAEGLVFECVELYVPKKLEHLSEIFTFLRNKLSEHGSRASGRRFRSTGSRSMKWTVRSTVNASTRSGPS